MTTFKPCWSRCSIAEGLRITRVRYVAADAGLADVYNTYYRALSNDAAHPSVISLGQHMDDQHHGFLWGPERNRVDETFEAACTALLYLITGLRSQLGEDAAKEPELEVLRDEHRALIKLMLRSLEGLDGDAD